MEQTTKQEFKTFSLAIDMVRTIGQPPFEVVWGDTGNLLCITLTNDGVPVDLTGAYTCVVFRSSIGTALQDDTNGLTLSDETGTFTLQLLPESYGAGDVSADIQVYTGKNRETLITSRRFTFRCRNALLNDKTMQANGTYPPLITATHAATEAAAYALAAAERNGDMLISVYDSDCDGKVERADRADHADHATTSDTLANKTAAYYATAASVKAISVESLNAAYAVHADQHKKGGNDPITPADIGAARTSTMLEATLYAASWTGTTAPYSYTLQLSAAGETDAVEILPEATVQTDILDALQAANIQDGGQNNGVLTLLAYGTKPTVDLPIRIIVRGDVNGSSAGGGAGSGYSGSEILNESGIILQKHLPEGYPYDSTIWLCKEQSVSFNNGEAEVYGDPLDHRIISGDIYTVSWNDEDYEVVADTNDLGLPRLRVDSLFSIVAMPSQFVLSGGAQLVLIDELGVFRAKFSIRRPGGTITKIDKKYLPDNIGSGGGTPTIVIHDSNYDKLLAGQTPDMDNITYTCSNMQFGEALALFGNGSPVTSILMSVFHDTGELLVTCSQGLVTMYTGGIFMMLFFDITGGGMKALTWGPTGINPMN